MQLIIDIGNSGAKVAVAAKNRLLTIERYAQLSPVDLQRLYDQYKPDTAIYSSVAAAYDGEVACMGWLEERMEKLICFNHKTPIPLKNLYRTPETLGADRLAAAIGANFLFPSSDCLVIDCGTAITIDYVSRHGEFIGGNISPGLQTRFKALHAFTGRLPLGRITDPPPVLGDDTASAVNAGVLQGALYEIEGYIDNYPGCNVVFTGGDALFFVKNIKNSIFVVCNLVLLGLNRVVNYNAYYI